jgi:ribonuclease BN (tRNA processing enzyme)
MKIKVLGCSGAEFPGHNPPGFLVDGEILFDAGSLTNVLDENAQHKIGNIFITHAHLDHIRGIPFLADNLIVKNKRHKVNVISIPPVIRTIKENLLNSSVWPDFTVLPDPDNAVINLVKIMEGESLKIKDYLITPFNVNHSVPAVGYLVEDSKKRLFYTGDTGPTDSTWGKIGEKKIDCLIIEVSFPNRMREMAVTTGHLTPRLLKEEVLKLKHMPEKIYITHPKPQYFKVIKTEIEKLKIKNLRVLKDGDIIRI